MLTDPEHLAMGLTAELTKVVLADVIGHGPTRHADVAEFTQAVHRIQNVVLSQAAARLYPDRYRLLGEQLPAASAPKRAAGPDERGGSGDLRCGLQVAHDPHTWIGGGIGRAAGTPVTYRCDGQP